MGHYYSSFSMRFRAVAVAVLIAFLATNVLTVPLASAQGITMPVPGEMIQLSGAFRPALIKGIKVDPKNPLAFEFLIAPAQTPLAADEKKEEYQKLIKYFFAALTTPEKDMWVNLSPYEHNRIISDNFAATEMGRDMLAQDYILKQLAASLVYPEGELGKKFWSRIYERIEREAPGFNLAVNTFNKIWIVPQSATIFEKGNVAMVTESRLKVLMEEDYVAMDKNAVGAGLAPAHKRATASVVPTDAHKRESNIVREIVIPAIETEVNEGKNFAQLRQMYNAMVLAAWFKQRLKKHVLNRVYANQDKAKGVDLKDLTEYEQIYQQYLSAYKKGVYNYIKEEQDPASGQMVARKYFSGGFDPALLSLPLVEPTTGFAAAAGIIKVTQEIPPAGLSTGQFDQAQVVLSAADAAESSIQGLNQVRFLFASGRPDKERLNEMVDAAEGEDARQMAFVLIEEALKADPAGDSDKLLLIGRELLALGKKGSLFTWDDPAGHARLVKSLVVVYTKVLWALWGTDRASSLQAEQEAGAVVSAVLSALNYEDTRTVPLASINGFVRELSAQMKDVEKIDQEIIDAVEQKIYAIVFKHRKTRQVINDLLEGQLQSLLSINPGLFDSLNRAFGTHEDTQRSSEELVPVFSRIIKEKLRIDDVKLANNFTLEEAQQLVQVIVSKIHVLLPHINYLNLLTQVKELRAVNPALADEIEDRNRQTSLGMLFERDEEKRQEIIERIRQTALKAGQALNPEKIFDVLELHEKKIASQRALEKAENRVLDLKRVPGSPLEFLEAMDALDEAAADLRGIHEQMVEAARGIVIVSEAVPIKREENPLAQSLVQGVVRSVSFNESGLTTAAEVNGEITAIDELIASRLERRFVLGRSSPIETPSRFKPAPSVLALPAPGPEAPLVESLVKSVVRSVSFSALDAQAGLTTAAEVTGEMTAIDRLIAKRPEQKFVLGASSDIITPSRPVKPVLALPEASAFPETGPVPQQLPEQEPGIIPIDSTPLINHVQEVLNDQERAIVDSQQRLSEVNQSFSALMNELDRLAILSEQEDNESILDEYALKLMQLQGAPGMAMEGVQKQLDDQEGRVLQAYEAAVIELRKLYEQIEEELKKDGSDKIVLSDLQAGVHLQLRKIYREKQRLTDVFEDLKNMRAVSLELLIPPEDLKQETVREDEVFEADIQAAEKNFMETQTVVNEIMTLIARLEKNAKQIAVKIQRHDANVNKIGLVQGLRDQLRLLQEQLRVSKQDLKDAKEAHSKARSEYAALLLLTPEPAANTPVQINTVSAAKNALDRARADVQRIDSEVSRLKDERMALEKKIAKSRDGGRSLTRPFETAAQKLKQKEREQESARKALEEAQAEYDAVQKAFPSVNPSAVPNRSQGPISAVLQKAFPLMALFAFLFVPSPDSKKMAVNVKKKEPEPPKTVEKGPLSAEDEAAALEKIKSIEARLITMTMDFYGYYIKHKDGRGNLQVTDVSEALKYSDLKSIQDEFNAVLKDKEVLMQRQGIRGIANVILTFNDLRGLIEAQKGGLILIDRIEGLPQFLQFLKSKVPPAPEPPPVQRTLPKTVPAEVPLTSQEPAKPADTPADQEPRKEEPKPVAARAAVPILYSIDDIFNKEGRLTLTFNDGTQKTINRGVVLTIKGRKYVYSFVQEGKDPKDLRWALAMYFEDTVTVHASGASKVFPQAVGDGKRSYDVIEIPLTGIKEIKGAQALYSLQSSGKFIANFNGQSSSVSASPEVALTEPGSSDLSSVESSTGLHLPLPQKDREPAADLSEFFQTRTARPILTAQMPPGGLAEAKKVTATFYYPNEPKTKRSSKYGPDGQLLLPNISIASREGRLGDVEAHFDLQGKLRGVFVKHDAGPWVVEEEKIPVYKNGKQVVDRQNRPVYKIKQKLLPRPGVERDLSVPDESHIPKSGRVSFMTRTIASLDWLKYNPLTAIPEDFISHNQVRMPFDGFIGDIREGYISLINKEGMVLILKGVSTDLPRGQELKAGEILGNGRRVQGSFWINGVAAPVSQLEKISPVIVFNKTASVSTKGGIDFDPQYLQLNIQKQEGDFLVPEGFQWLLTQPVAGFTPKILEITSGGSDLSFFKGIGLAS